jgi:hypothetical protein
MQMPDTGAATKRNAVTLPAEMLMVNLGIGHPRTDGGSGLAAHIRPRVGRRVRGGRRRLRPDGADHPDHRRQHRHTGGNYVRLSSARCCN